MPFKAFRNWQHLTIQARIAWLVVACILPASLLAAFVTYLSYGQERSNIRQQALATTRELMRVVETNLGADEATAQTLALSGNIDNGDFAAFHQQAKEVLHFTSAYTIVLTDASGQQIVNLLQPFGAPLPSHGNRELLRRTLDTRKPVVSDLFIGSVTKMPTLAIEVPVIRDGKALYGLALAIDPKHLGDMLQKQGLPPEWVVSIFDRNGTIVARTHDAEQYVGKTASLALLQAMRQARDGMLVTPTQEGVPVVSAFSRSPAYGWTVSIGVPEAVLTADLRRWLAMYAVGGSLLLLAGLGMATMIGRSIARPIQALVAPALDIGNGEPVSIPPLELREADEVRQALLKAQQLLDKRERERDQAEQAERQMLLAKQSAEHASEAKAAYLANVSHALRTPLNAILGFSRMMRNDPDATPEQMRNLGIINRSGEHLLNLINNVLDISKIEAGHAKLENSEFDLHSLMDEITTLMQVQAADKGLAFTLVHPPELPACIVADANKLRQMLVNLVGNAIKFTRNGGVVLRAGVARWESPQLARVRFEVEDTGPGIDAVDSERIFSPFVQLGDEPATEAGTGLGLHISKQYAELMGGQIGVASQPGKGSVFHFEIPLRIARTSNEISARPRLGPVIGLAPGQPRYRLLIADDQPDNRLLLQEMLAPLGFDLREAVDGREAVALFEQWHPHLIWMDIRMPEMDGLEATGLIRANGSGTQTKIVAVTAHAAESERGDILAAGCDDFIRKPYRKADIFDTLEKHLGVHFLYAEDQTPDAAAETAGVSLARLEELPLELLEELREAAVLLDRERLAEVTGRIARIDDKLAARLDNMLKNLRHKELLAQLDPIITRTVA
jgi:signal transduction histidine kinase/CheY-like chemotaxis protein